MARSYLRISLRFDHPFWKVLATDFGKVRPAISEIHDHRDVIAGLAGSNTAFDTVGATGGGESRDNSMPTSRRANRPAAGLITKSTARDIAERRCREHRVPLDAKPRRGDDQVPTNP